MPSSYTANYNLSQWEPEDAVRRVDFNGDNAKIDKALKDTANALSAEVSARSAAVSSLSWSVARRGNCDVRTSSYTGNGEKTRTLSFSSAPKLVVIIGPQAAAVVSAAAGASFVQDSAHGVMPNTLTVSLSGAQMTISLPYGGDSKSLMNTSGASYQVVSFHDVS